MEIKIPEFSLVVLIGASGSGKSSFAKKHFKRTEILSSDECRALVSDDENNQAATDDAFELLFYLAGKRLKNGLLTVIDATNTQKPSRNALIQLAKTYHCLPVAIVLDLPEDICEARNKLRPDRKFKGHVIRQQQQQLRKALRGLKKEGFRSVAVLNTPEEVDAVTAFTREKLYNDKRDESGPFDIIGDVHGCFEELCELLTALGYGINKVEADDRNFGFNVIPPQGRKAIFVGI